jgi:hypothetical protein
VIPALIIASRLWTLTPDLPPLDEVGAAPVLVVDAALRAGVDPVWAWSVAWRESRFRWWRVSSGGALGPYQIKPYQCEGPCGPIALTYAGGRTLARYAPRPDFERTRNWKCGRAGARLDPECGVMFSRSVLARHDQLERALRARRRR